MGRTPGVAAPDPSLLRRDRAPLFDLEVSVVTPLFGGSATPATADPLRPVRASSVRGHLRFWWRACKGATFATAEELFQEEESIWGSTAYPSPITVTTSVEAETAGTLVQPGEYQRRDDGRFPAYALFPFQEIENAALESVRFRLLIVVDEPAPRGDKPCKTKEELRHAVEAALWAWFTFGGIGARTRRGCGSLFCRDFAPDSTDSLTTWLRNGAARYVDGRARQVPMPVLQEARLVVGNSDDAGNPIQTWQTVVNVMRSFRQVPIGRRPGKVPRHSRWPEADSIRRTLHRYDPERPREHGVESGQYYPRADLGLPIIFQFKQNKNGSEPPNKYTLELAEEGAARMASPIILKPLALSATKTVPFVVCLDAPHVWEIKKGEDESAPVVLKEKQEHQAAHVVGSVTNEQLNNPTLSPSVPPLRQFGANKARDAFLTHAAQELNGSRTTFRHKERTR